MPSDKKSATVTIKTGNYHGRQLKVDPGSPIPFGATAHHDGINFSLFSRNAKAVSIILSLPESADPLVEIPFDEDCNKTGDVWHMFIAQLPPGVQYAYRIAGEYNSQRGLYYDEKKLLIDPFARLLSGVEKWGEPRGVLRCGIVQEIFDWENDRPINRPLKDSIIYEMHVRGFTQHKSSGVDNPGTFMGIVEKIPYLKKLGITAVELMPINEFDENDCLFTHPKTGEKLKNYWGYNSIAFFAPKASFAASVAVSGQVEEFKRMVRALHKEGIEVILDVVFNHTAEGNEKGSTVSFRGIENAVYYLLDERYHYKNYSGCGNTMNCNHPIVREMILHCLRYWVSEMHVDGFRFDLASILGRDENGNVLSNPPVLEAIAQDPVLSGTKIIAEAWDAAGLYQVGQFPAWKRWGEWNDKYRDSIRRFIKGDSGVVGEIATRVAGSSDLYQASGRKPYHSINYVTCHDGFTLFDCVSYNEKHNKDNGENNGDGHSLNHSWNCGAEGKTRRPLINKLRKRQIKNFIALLMVSQGTPMVLAGDEVGRTQKGNNNAYCQDNELSWLDWSLMNEHEDIFNFMKEMIRFRKMNSLLRREDFFTGQSGGEHELPDITWHGTRLRKPNFQQGSHSLAFHISGKIITPGESSDIYVAINASKKSLMFSVPSLNKHEWHLKVDTSKDAPHEIYRAGKEPRIGFQKSYPVKPHALIILVGRNET
ncbi:MAG: glycogen debranching protein GlgX [Candidatus Omnitrophica bacterium]|nr:glycogen debranching protein GlgX [Candidatus Omnitrophota bacterium]